MGANHEDECPCSLAADSEVPDQAIEEPMPTGVGEETDLRSILPAMLFGMGAVGGVFNSKIVTGGPDVALDNFEVEIRKLEKQKSIPAVVGVANAAQHVLETYDNGTAPIEGAGRDRCVGALKRLNDTLPTIRNFELYEEGTNSSECNALRSKMKGISVLGKKCEGAGLGNFSSLYSAVDQIRDTRPYLDRRVANMSAIIVPQIDFVNNTTPDPYLLAVMLQDAQNIYEDLLKIDISDTENATRRQNDTRAFLRTVAPDGYSMDTIIENGTSIVDATTQMALDSPFRKIPLATPEVARYANLATSAATAGMVLLKLASGEKVELRNGATIFSSPNTLYEAYSYGFYKGTLSRDNPERFVDKRYGFSTCLSLKGDFNDALEFDGATLKDILKGFSEWTEEIVSNLERWYRERIQKFVLAKANSGTLRGKENLLRAAVATSQLFEPFWLYHGDTGERAGGVDLSQTVPSSASLARRIVSMALLPLPLHKSPAFEAGERVWNSFGDDADNAERWCYHIAARKRALFEPDTFFPREPTNKTFGMLRPVDFPEPISQEWFLALAHKAPINRVVECLEGSCLFPNTTNNTLLNQSHLAKIRVNLTYHGAPGLVTLTEKDSFKPINYNQGAQPFLGGEHSFGANDAGRALDMIRQFKERVDKDVTDKYENMYDAFCGIVLHSLSLYGEFTTFEMNQRFSSLLDQFFENIQKEASPENAGRTTHFPKSIKENLGKFLTEYRTQVRQFLFADADDGDGNAYFSKYADNFQSALDTTRLNQKFSLAPLGGFVRNLKAVYLYFWAKVTLSGSSFGITDSYRQQSVADYFESNVAVRPPGVQTTGVFSYFLDSESEIVCVAGNYTSSGQITFDKREIRANIVGFSKNNQIKFRDEGGPVDVRDAAFLIDPSLELQTVMAIVEANSALPSEITVEDFDTTPPGATSAGLGSWLSSEEWMKWFNSDLNAYNEFETGFKGGYGGELGSAGQILAAFAACEGAFQAFEVVRRKFKRNRAVGMLTASVKCIVAQNIMIMMTVMSGHVTRVEAHPITKLTPFFYVNPQNIDVLGIIRPINITITTGDTTTNSPLSDDYLNLYTITGQLALVYLYRKMSIEGLSGLESFLVMAGSTVLTRATYYYLQEDRKFGGSWNEEYRNNADIFLSLLFMIATNTLNGFIGKLAPGKSGVLQHKGGDGTGRVVYLSKGFLRQKVAKPNLNLAKYLRLTSSVPLIIFTQTVIPKLIKLGMFSYFTGQEGEEPTSPGKAFGILNFSLVLINVFENLLYSVANDDTEKAMDEFVRLVAEDAEYLSKGSKFLEFTLRSPAQVRNILTSGDESLLEPMARMLQDSDRFGILVADSGKELSVEERNYYMEKQFGKSPPSFVFHFYRPTANKDTVKVEFIVNNYTDFVDFDSQFTDPRELFNFLVVPARKAIQGDSAAAVVSKAAEQLLKLRQGQSKLVDFTTETSGFKAIRQRDGTYEERPTTSTRNTVQKLVKGESDWVDTAISAVTTFVSVAGGMASFFVSGTTAKLQGEAYRAVFEFMFMYILSQVALRGDFFRYFVLGPDFESDETEAELDYDPRQAYAEFERDRVDTAAAREVVERAPVLRAGRQIKGTLVYFNFFKAATRDGALAGGNVGEVDLIRFFEAKDSPYRPTRKIIDRTLNPLFLIILSDAGPQSRFYTGPVTGKVRRWGGGAVLEELRPGMTVIIDSNLRTNMQNIQSRIKTGSEEAKQLL